MAKNDFVLETRDLTFQYGRGGAGTGQLALDRVNIRVRRGSVTTALGANGSGKSTLFHLMAGSLSAKSGRVLFEGTDVSKIKPRDYARKIAVVHQSNPTFGDVTVETLVSYGRTPFLPFFGRPDAEDLRLVERAMEIADVVKFRERKLGSLSGGQRQRVWIAMALAQNTETILLDEPTTWLDVRYQIQILQLVRRLNREFGVTVVMVLHDVNQAICYSDEIVGLKDGRVCGQGRAQDMATADFVEEIYGIRLQTAKYDGGTFVLQI